MRCSARLFEQRVNNTGSICSRRSGMSQMHDTVVEQPEDDALILDMLERFLKTEVKPYVHALEKADEYPTEIVEQMKEMGLFGCLIDPEYGGLGLSARTYARIVER